MIKCAHCKGKHDTVQQVKDCSRNNFEETTEQRCRPANGVRSLTEQYDAETLRRKREAVTRLAPRSPGMIKTGPNGIMAQLQRMRPATLEDSRNAAIQRETFTGGNKQSPREVKPSTTGFPKVPEGHYAIERDGQVKFYKINHGKPGTRWDGYVFLDVQASDVYYPIKNREHKQEILAAIAEDVEGAMTRYGREIGRCGAPRCGRTLTDPESIARGIGPVCAGKMGW